MRALLLSSLSITLRILNLKPDFRRFLVSSLKACTGLSKSCTAPCWSCVCIQDKMFRLKSGLYNHTATTLCRPSCLSSDWNLFWQCRQMTMRSSMRHFASCLLVCWQPQWQLQSGHCFYSTCTLLLHIRYGFGCPMRTPMSN